MDLMWNWDSDPVKVLASWGLITCCGSSAGGNALDLLTEGLSTELGITIMSMTQETGTVLCSSVICNCSLDRDEPFERRNRTLRVIQCASFSWITVFLFPLKTTCEVLDDGLI